MGVNKKTLALVLIILIGVMGIYLVFSYINPRSPAVSLDMVSQRFLSGFEQQEADKIIITDKNLPASYDSSEVVLIDGRYVSPSDPRTTTQTIIQGGGGGVWGFITGILSEQTDLQGALNAKENAADFEADLNAGIVSQSCPVGEALQQLGTFFTCIPVGGGGFDTNWQTSWGLLDLNLSAYFKRCAPSAELCYDSVDNDCDGLTDCADTIDCNSVNFLCRSPIGVLGSAFSGNAGEIAATSATTNYSWERGVNLVVRNNSNSSKMITQIDVNGLTKCIGMGAWPNVYCNGATAQVGTGENPIHNTESSADPTTLSCGSLGQGILEAGDLNFVGASNPWAAIIGGGVIDLYDACTRVKSGVFLEAGEETGVRLQQIYPDWCLGSSWGNAVGKQVGLKIYFSDGSVEYISDLNMSCRENNGSSYSGLFDYIPSLGWGGFPNVWVPINTWQAGVSIGIPPTYKVKAADQFVGDDSGIITGLGFYMQADKLYSFQCNLDMNASNVLGGIQTTMTATAAATWVNYRIDGWTSTTTEVVSNKTAYNDYQANATSQGTPFYIYQIKGSVLNGANASIISPEFGIGTYSATVRAGSWCLYTTLGV